MVEVAQPGRQGASLLLVSERSTHVKRPSMVLLRIAAVLTQADKQKLHIALELFSLISSVTDALGNCDPWGKCKSRSLWESAQIWLLQSVSFFIVLVFLNNLFFFFFKIKYITKLSCFQMQNRWSQPPVNQKLSPKHCVCSEILQAPILT